MADVRSLVRRLGLDEQRVQAVEQRANEYVRISGARLGAGGLGQGELCKGAACVELACMALGTSVDAALLARHSGVPDRVYRNAKAALQKVLGVTSKATARELCVQFGCARHDQSVRAALTAYKERFVRALPPEQQRRVDFGRPVFLAAAFYLVARKNKVAVDRTKLLGPLGVTATEFSQTCASLSDLCADLVGAEPRKRKAETPGADRRALIDRTGPNDDGDVAGSSDEEVEDEGQVGYRINPRKQRQRDYDEWKQQVLAQRNDSQADSGDAGADGAGAPISKGGAQKVKLTEKKLRQAEADREEVAPGCVLSFAAPRGGSVDEPQPTADAGAAAGRGKTAAGKHGQQAGSSAEGAEDKQARISQSTKGQAAMYSSRAALGHNNSCCA